MPVFTRMLPTLFTAAALRALAATPLCVWTGSVLAQPERVDYASVESWLCRGDVNVVMGDLLNLLDLQALTYLDR